MRVRRRAGQSPISFDLRHAKQRDVSEFDGGDFLLKAIAERLADSAGDGDIVARLGGDEFVVVQDHVTDALADSGLPPARLELEITETLLLGDDKKVMDELRELKEMGVAVVMDDFGTGYSSLGYLWRFPFDKIKIDRSFIHAFEDSSRDALGRQLQMQVTVEGVETAKQAAFVDNADADQVQGFFFSRPIPVEDLGACILEDARRPAMQEPTATDPRQSAGTSR